MDGNDPAKKMAREVVQERKKKGLDLKTGEKIKSEEPEKETESIE